MSIEKLKRDLMSCGKDFAIDNFNEIKRYSEGGISKSDLYTIIRAKEKWANISTLDNRVSAIKMIIENNQIEDALKITIGSRANIDVINKAKNIFENELGRPYDEVTDSLEIEGDSNLLPEILNELKNKSIQDLCSFKEFQFQKGKEKLIEFESYNKLSKDQIISLLEELKESKKTYSSYIKDLDHDSEDFMFLTLTGQLISYCDVHAASKETYNEYEDKRTIAKAGVRMNDWIDKLFNYKIQGNDTQVLTPSIKNAIEFLKNPLKGLTMLSEKHREKFSLTLLNKNYQPENIVDDLTTFFEPYNIQVENEENRTSVYCSILYSSNVNQLWLNDETLLDSNETRNLKKKNNMKIPLNQIFYGPPGTGKTYNISSEAKKIINSTKSSENLTLDQKFERIVKNIRSEYYKDIYNKLNGNNIYRNFSKAMVVWGYFLDPKNDSTNTIIHEDLKDEEGFKRSGWSQRIRYLTEFGFIEGDWRKDFSGQLGFDMQLSKSGLELKKNLRSYSEGKNISPNELRSWPREKGLPEILISSYVKVLAEVSPISRNITAFEKTIFCALNMCLKGDLFKQNRESRPTTEEEIGLVEQYFDVNSTGNSDYKWIGWIAENLVDLNLVEEINEERFNRYYYQITDAGRNLVEEIVEKWQSEYSILFDEYINYETGVGLGQIEFITFHQSYSYEEFIEGIRPNLDGKNELTYSLEKGIFKRISDRAKFDQDNNYVIIIDEINRGNISKIFGELITLIEPSKRLFTENGEHPKKVTLPYSKKRFGVPKNLYILGTMNTADKSIALLDSALRRRFSFTEMLPNSKVIKDNISIENIDVKLLFETINSRVEYLIDKDHTIGHSYFIKIKDNQTIEALASIFKNEIIPLLIEYFYGDFEKIQLVLGDNKDWKKGDNKFFSKKASQQKSLFGKEEAVEGYDEKIIFELNDDLLGQNKDGSFKGNSDKLVELFKSVYTQ